APVQDGAVEANDATGVALITITTVLVAKHPVVGSVVVRVTVLFPADEYVTPVGFCAVEVAGVAPAPKLHEYVTPTAVPVLVKFTELPVHCGALDVNVATGVASITILCWVVTLQPVAMF